MSVEKGRIAWLDAAKGIAIAIVVASHSIGGEWFYPFSCFVMPMFFVSAGYSLNLQKWKDRKLEFFISRAKKILIPFFLIELCFFPIWVVRSFFMPPVGTKLPPVEAFFGIFDGNCANLPIIALWFLPCFFLAENIFLLIFRDRPTEPNLRDILTALILSVIGYEIGSFKHIFWGFDIALFVQGYMIVGRFLRAVDFQKLSGIFCILLPIILITLQVYVNQSFDMASRSYGENPVLAYISGIFECILVMRLMQIFVRKNEEFLAEMGRRSMSIYLLHPFVQIIISDILLLTVVNGDYGTLFYIWQAGVPILIFGIIIPIYISRNYSKKPFIRYLWL